MLVPELPDLPVPELSRLSVSRLDVLFFAIAFSFLLLSMILAGKENIIRVKQHNLIAKGLLQGNASHGQGTQRAFVDLVFVFLQNLLV